MLYLRSTITGKIIDGDVLMSLIKDILGENSGISNPLLSYVTPIDPPSVIACLNCGNNDLAVNQYLKAHPNCTKEQAYKEVNMIEQDLKNRRYRKNKFKYHKKQNTMNKPKPIEEAVNEAEEPKIEE